MIRNDRYPHVFQPLTVRGLTLKNRLEYAPTVVLKCSPEGEVTQEMLDYVAWQAKTGVGYLTIGNTPVVHTDSSAWVCELNVTQDRCIHGLEMMARTARENGAEMSVELAHAGRGSNSTPGNPALAPSDVPLNGGPLGYIKPMNEEDMAYVRQQFVDCAIRCRKAGLKIVMIHCAHNNLLAQFLSPASNHRTDDYGGSLENRMRFPLSVLKAVREAVPDMVIECRCSAQEDTPDGLQLEESLQFMERAQEYVDIIHVSRGNIFFNYGSTYTANMVVMIVYIVWNALPFKILILLGGLQAINKQYYEAARVDSTPRWRVFTRITVPLVSPMLAYVIITGFIGGFKEYTSIVGIFGETMGPPNDGGRLNTMVGFIYDSLSNNSQGRASAAALILFGIILVVTLINLWVSKKRVHY